MTLPVCRPKHLKATALYIVQNPASAIPGEHILRTEFVWVRDGCWMVKRDKRLVPLAATKPVPDALQFADGTVENGNNRWWPDRPAFLRAHGIDPDPIKKKEFDR